MPKHPHAELMMQYAQDAMETDTPWERWEWGCNGCQHQLTQHPVWHKRLEYRRKPLTHIVNGHEVPAPRRTEPNEGEKYYLIDPSIDGGVDEYTWYGDRSNQIIFSYNNCFYTREDALQNFKAMFKLDEYAE